MSSLLFIGFKCMIDCTYWYNKELNPDFDFDVAQGYASFTDEIIRDNWSKLSQYVNKAPVVLIAGDETYYTLVTKSASYNPGKAFNRHNKIVTYRWESGWFTYKYLSAPEDINGDSVFAVVPTAGNSIDSKRIRKHIYQIGYRNEKVWVSDDWAYIGKTTYNLATDAYYPFLDQLVRYLQNEYEESELYSDIANVGDLIVGTPEPENIEVAIPDSIDAVTGRYNNIYALLQNKGRIQDRYDRLISALSLLDAELPSNLNYLLESAPDEAQSKIVDLLSKAEGSKE